MPQPPKKQTPPKQAPADQLVSELNRLLGGYGYRAQREPVRDEYGYVSPNRAKAMKLLEENRQRGMWRDREDMPGDYYDKSWFEVPFRGEERTRHDQLYMARQMMDALEARRKARKGM